MQRLLIVDDEPKVCECLRLFFSAKGYSASCAYTGEQALESLIEDQPDIVLLDVGLPDVSGLEVLKRSKDLCPQARVIMVTGYNDGEMEETARAHGAKAYITKPFDFSDLTWASVFTAPS